MAGGDRGAAGLRDLPISRSWRRAVRDGV